MTARMLWSSHSGRPRAAMAVMAVGIVLVAAGAYATIKVTEPSARTLSVSDVIVVARVDRVLGHEPFTNKNPPSVLATVQDGIRGATRGEAIRIVGWVTGAPTWEAMSQRDAAIRRWESRAAIPPAVGAEALLFLKRTGQHEATLTQSMNGPVFVISPDPGTIEIVRGTAGLTLTVRPIRRATPSRRSIEIGGVIVNHSADSMVFDLPTRSSHLLLHADRPRTRRAVATPSSSAHSPRSRRAPRVLIPRGEPIAGSDRRAGRLLIRVPAPCQRQ